jgi:uncharacterized protein (TIGR01777 family)
VTGATGFIGRALVPKLLSAGFGVIALVRNARKAAALLGPRVELTTDVGELGAERHIDAIVNLAGESIAGGLWTRRRRETLLASRLGVTRDLLRLVARLERHPRTWLNGSAIGYYGARFDDEPLDEHANAGAGFQAELCRRWEETAAEAAAHGVAVTALRLGVVLGSDGGALPSFVLPARWHVGLAFGTGRQWFSWIHRDDLLALMLFALERGDLTGPINAVAPHAVRQAELMRTIAAVLGRWQLPGAVPAVLLRAALGELAELFVDGQRVAPARASALGFQFRYPSLESALRALLQ